MEIAVNVMDVVDIFATLSMTSIMSNYPMLRKAWRHQIHQPGWILNLLTAHPFRSVFDELAPVVSAHQLAQTAAGGGRKQVHIRGREFFAGLRQQRHGGGIVASAMRNARLDQFCVWMRIGD